MVQLLGTRLGDVTAAFSAGQACLKFCSSSGLSWGEIPVKHMSARALLRWVVRRPEAWVCFVALHAVRPTLLHPPPSRIAFPASGAKNDFCFVFCPFRMCAVLHYDTVLSSLMHDYSLTNKINR